MLKVISNLTKATLSVVVTPIAVLVDVVTLPSTAYDNKHPFGNTKAMLCQAGKLVKETVNIKDDSTKS